LVIDRSRKPVTPGASERSSVPVIVNALLSCAAADTVSCATVLAVVLPEVPVIVRVYDPTVVAAEVETCSDVVLPVVDGGVKLTPELGGVPVTEKLIEPVKFVRVTVTA
jgi:hypothetical protein